MRKATPQHLPPLALLLLLLLLLLLQPSLTPSQLLSPSRVAPPNPTP